MVYSMVQVGVRNNTVFDIDRDPSVSKLESDVLSRCLSLVPDEVTPSVDIPTNRQLPSDNRQVSLEDALRELRELEKQGLL